MHESETLSGPTESTSHVVLQKDMGFSFCQAIGELLFAAITCHPDILYCIINLSQYNIEPAHIHYTSLKRVFCYLRYTITDGLH